MDLLRNPRNYLCQRRSLQRSIRMIMNVDADMSSYKEYKEKALQNAEVKAEYEALQPEYDIIQAMIEARVSQNITQKELSERTGITQAQYQKQLAGAVCGALCSYLETEGESQ